MESKALKRPIEGIYAITSEFNHCYTWFTTIESALTAGIQVLQFRSKQLDYAQQLRIARQLKTLCQATDTVFIINDNIQLAYESRADGVHLGQGDGSIADARSQLGHQAIIGRTCHADLSLALEAEQQGADYVAFGQVFTSSSKVSTHRASLDFLKQAQANIDIPIVAIGGITLDNAAAVFETKIASIAMIQGLWACATAQDLAHTVFQLNQFWRQSNY